MTLEIPLSLLLYPLVGLLVYFPSLAGWSIFDDSQTIGKVEPLTWKRVGRLWKFREYRPLTSLIYSVQRSWPNTMRGLHVGNVLIHAVNGLVLEKIALEMGLDAGLATLAGLIFVIHPFAVNTVGFVTGRASILAAFFGFSAVLALLSGFWWVTFPLIVLSFLSKEDGLGFVPLILAISLLQGEWLCGALYIMMGIAYFWVRRAWFFEFLTRNGDEAMGNSGLPVSYPQPIHAIVVLVETLIRLPFWAFGLKTSPYHGSAIPIPGLFREFQAWIVAGVLGYALLSWPIPTLFLLCGPWLIYLACPVPDQLIEYRNYSQTAGFALFLALLLSGSGPVEWWSALVFCGGLTARYACNWKGPAEMWEAAVKHTSGDPSRAHQELGAWWKIQGQTFRAETHLRAAIEANPNLAPALNNLAWVLHDQAAKEQQLAIEEEQKGRPYLAGMYRRRAFALMDESIETMKACTERCPRYAVGWEELGILYEVPGRFEDAIPCYQQALSLDPSLVRSANKLGVVAFTKKDYSGAAALFDKALSQHPGHFEYLYNRACVWAATGHPEKAKTLLEPVQKPFPQTRNMIPFELAKVSS